MDYIYGESCINSPSSWILSVGSTTMSQKLENLDPVVSGITSFIPQQFVIYLN